MSTSADEVTDLSLRLIDGFVIERLHYNHERVDS